ncbi:type I secretion system permease/ATPase [Marinobacterium sp. xm-m-383]|uniref:type I secretion system permease/ATPase n=1 Tax=unclassified Marinobacterium TaxID=2644139 RepID=UPI0019F4274C|nr:Toxin RTX-I translocation ATP-binding protein [Marinobacterium sp. xm-v-242]NRP77860.1 Toxin RTX-I translocation ATP-binding protein [Marinobacterium sp. xm-m-383]
MNQFESAIYSITTLAKLRHKACDTEQLRHQWQTSKSTLTETDFIRALNSLNLKAGIKNCKISDLNNEFMPVAAPISDGQYLTLLRVNQKGHDWFCLVIKPGETTPRKLNLAEFDQLWDSKIIFIKEREASGSDCRFDLKWFIPSLIKHKGIFTEVIIISVFLQLFALATPFFFQIVMDKVLVHRGFTTLDILAIGFAALLMFELVMGIVRNYLMVHTTSRIDVELGAKLFNHVMRLPAAYFDSRQVGHTVARIKELDTLREFITGGALTLMIDLSFLLLFIAVLWMFSPTLTWIVLGSLPCYLLLSILITPTLRHRLNESFKRSAENQAFLVESITGIDTVKSMALEPKMQQRWEKQIAQATSIGFKAKNLGNIATQIAQFISKFTTVLIIWFGALLVMDNQLTIGELIAFNMIAGRVSAPILKLVQLWQDVQQAGISLKRLGDILNTPSESDAQTSQASLPSLQGSIAFQHVSFRYSLNSPTVLNRINLEINAGESIGIVGASGSGKSTLTKLIQRTYLPNLGKVLIDGVDLAQVNTDWLRSNISVVPQESFLFNKSVRDNIAIRTPGESLETIVKAAKLAGAHAFITELPAAYDTLVGERGSNLSGGQRQRIAIARALISNPKILIFDEATSALDYISEEKIRQQMHLICKGRTVITVAHRLNTVRHCDRIIVIDQGELAESGTHQELLRLNGRYAEMFRLQSADQPSEFKEAIA